MHVKSRIRESASLHRAAWFAAFMTLCGSAQARHALYAHTIADEKTWSSLAARPQSAAAARIEVVKFLLDLEDGRRLWFTNTNRYQDGEVRCASPGIAASRRAR